MYDFSKNTSNTDKAESFHHAFCQQQFSSQAGAEEYAGSLGFKMLSLGYDQQTSNFQQWYSNYCSDQGFKSKFKQNTESVVQTINPKQADNLATCLRLDEEGLHAWIIQGPDWRSFQLHLRYIQPSHGPEIWLVQIKPRNAECGFVIGSPIEVHRGRDLERSLSCTRGADAVDINIDPAPREDPSLTFPAYAPPQPPPPSGVNLMNQLLGVKWCSYVKEEQVSMVLFKMNKDQVLVGRMRGGPSRSTLPHHREHKIEN
jgi:hypothetical protein